MLEMEESYIIFAAYFFKSVLELFLLNVIFVIHLTCILKSWKKLDNILLRDNA